MFGDLFGQRSDYSEGMFYGGHRRYLNPRDKSVFEPPTEFKTRRQYRNSKRLEAGDDSSEHTEKLTFHINFQKKMEAPEEHVDLNKKFKKVATIIKTTVILEHFSSLQRSDWTEDIQAGCHIWINKNTGEVVSVCPWQEAIDHEHERAMNSQRDTINSGRDSTMSSIADGTAGYDSARSGSHNILQNSGRNALIRGNTNHHINTSHHGHHHVSHNASIASTHSAHTASDEVTEFGTGSLVYDSTELENLFDTLDRMAPPTAASPTKDSKK